MDEIKLADGAHAGLLAMHGDACLVGSQRRGMPRYRFFGRT